MKFDPPGWWWWYSARIARKLKRQARAWTKNYPILGGHAKDTHDPSLTVADIRLIPLQILPPNAHTHTEQQENNQKNWFMSRKLCLVCVRISKIAFFPAMHIYVGEDASRMLLAARSRLHMRTRKAPQCIADEPRGSCMVSPGFLYFHFHTYIVVCDPDLSDRS